MKLVKVTLSVALLGALSLGMADETANIDAQIETVQSAPAQERVQMMNEFKQKLTTMNQEDRMAAIAQMQEKMHGNMQVGGEFGSHEGANGGMGEQTHQRAHDMVQEHQMNANEHMGQMQNTNQNHVGSQFNHINAQGGASHNGGASQGGASQGGASRNGGAPVRR